MILWPLTSTASAASSCNIFRIGCTSLPAWALPSFFKFENVPSLIKDKNTCQRPKHNHLKALCKWKFVRQSPMSRLRDAYWWNLKDREKNTKVSIFSRDLKQLHSVEARKTIKANLVNKSDTAAHEATLTSCETPDGCSRHKNQVSFYMQIFIWHKNWNKPSLKGIVLSINLPYIHRQIWVFHIFDLKRCPWLISDPITFC